MKNFCAAALILSAVLLQITHAKTKELFVYTSRKEHLVKDIFKKYEQESGVKIKYRTGKAGVLIQSLMSEGKKSRVDILLTADAGNLGFASSQGLLAPITSKQLHRNIPSHLRDQTNRWFGFSVRARTLVYNTTKVKKSDLSTYEDLAKPKWKGRLCLRTSKKVYNQSLVAMMIHELGRKKTRDVVAGWVKNAVEIFSNDTAVLKAVAAGQCDVGIVNTYYYGRLMKKAPHAKIKLFWPNQNSYGVHVNVSGAGVTKYSKHKKEAIKFLEWLASESAQNEFAQVNMEYPILDSIQGPKEAKKWGAFTPNTSFNLTDAGVLQKDAIRLMHEVNYK